MHPTIIDNHQDLLDVRDIIERAEEIENDQENATPDEKATKAYEDDQAELKELTTLLNDLKGYGGDHQWRGDWYPVTLIHEDYFQEYAEDLAADIHGRSTIEDAEWPMNYIDWEAAADALKDDYSTVEYQDDYSSTTYYYR
jgi:hypothetical protein